MPWGQVPVVEVDGKKYGQTTPICKFVGKLANLAGKNDVEDLEIDSVVETLGDLSQSKFILYLYIWFWDQTINDNYGGKQGCEWKRQKQWRNKS